MENNDKEIRNVLNTIENETSTEEYLRERKKDKDEKVRRKIKSVIIILMIIYMAFTILLNINANGIKEALYDISNNQGISEETSEVLIIPKIIVFAIQIIGLYVMVFCLIRLKIKDNIKKCICLFIILNIAIYCIPVREISYTYTYKVDSTSDIVSIPDNAIAPITGYVNIYGKIMYKQ